MTIDLPYFDVLLPALERGEREITTAFGRHVHWGFWERAEQADGSMQDFALAAERMCRRVCDAAGVADDQRILDIGCGIGGTLESLDRRLHGADLWGLNIDERQLALARRTLGDQSRNRIELVCADACALPFEDDHFDTVLAVECAFHFSSRARFLAEAARVLKPGGRLALCDFMPHQAALPLLFLKRMAFGRYVDRVVGPTDLSYSLERYRQAALEAGLRVVGAQDVTRNTLPTYRVVRAAAQRLGKMVATAWWGTAGLQLLGRLGMLRYVILGLEKPGVHNAEHAVRDGRSREPATITAGATASG